MPLPFATFALETIAQLCEALRHPRAPLRRLLLDGLDVSTGIEAASLERLTDLFAEAWSPTALRRAIARAIGDSNALRGPVLRLGSPHRFLARPAGRVAVIAPGNLPVATWQAMLEPLGAGCELRVKPGSGDPDTPERLRRALGELSPETARRIEVCPFPSDDLDALTRFLADVDVVAVHGSDDAVRAVRATCARACPDASFVAHGHGLSLGWLGREIWQDVSGLQLAARAFAHDALLADGRGCMSLRAVLVEGLSRADEAAKLSAAFGEALESCAAELPPGRIDTALLASHRAALEAVRFVPAARVSSGPNLEWSLAVLPAATGLALDTTDVGPGARHLRVLPVFGPPHLIDALRPLAPHLSTLGVAEAASAQDALRSAAALAGFRRLCPAGRMQAPPADRAPDGRMPFASFLSLVDVEEPPRR